MSVKNVFVILALALILNSYTALAVVSHPASQININLPGGGTNTLQSLFDSGSLGGGGASQWTGASPGPISYSDGNVGIGTSSPSTSLHVKREGTTLILEGTTHSRIDYYPDGMPPTATRKAWIGYASSSSGDNFEIRNEVTGAHILLMPLGTGNVGIGVTPIEKLHVQGNILASNTFMSNAGTNPAGNPHFALRTTTGVNRFILGLDGAESGSDSGSNFQIWRYNDAGSFLDSAISINRQNGNIIVKGNITAPNTPKRFVGSAFTDYVGDVGNYAGADALCNAIYSGSRVCTLMDFSFARPPSTATVGLYNTYTIATYYTGQEWGLLSDCNGWSTNQEYALEWSGGPRIFNCANTNLNFACCR